jgi:hypothetical protein
MGGIVAAETFLLISSEQPIPAKQSAMNPETPNFPSNTTMASGTQTAHPNPIADAEKVSFMFPHISGMLAFDTPYLGLAPSMFAHGIESGHKVASSAWDTASEVAGIFGWGSKSEPNMGSPPGPGRAPKALTQGVAVTDPNADAAAVPRWQTWGKYAMYAGAVGAVAAGASAAIYSQRETISAGWGWAQSHLLFVGALAKVEEMTKRVANVEKALEERGGGCANLYTRLGKGARESWGVTETIASGTLSEGGLQVGRTFCNLPQKAKDAIEKNQKQGKGMKWLPMTNEKAKDETTAHMYMFTPKTNPGFYAMGETAKDAIISWVDQGWYASSDRKPGLADGWITPDLEEEHKDQFGLQSGWEKMEREKRMSEDSSRGKHPKKAKVGKENSMDMEEDTVFVDRIVDGGEA